MPLSGEPHFKPGDVFSCTECGEEVLVPEFETAVEVAVSMPKLVM
jgi:hypothetical protein